MVDFKNFLHKLQKNLNILREREAKYGGNEPLELRNQINDYEGAICLTNQAIAGELAEDDFDPKALGAILVE